MGLLVNPSNDGDAAGAKGPGRLFEAAFGTDALEGLGHAAGGIQNPLGAFPVMGVQSLRGPEGFCQGQPSRAVSRQENSLRSRQTAGRGSQDADGAVPRMKTESPEETPPRRTA